MSEEPDRRPLLRAIGTGTVLAILPRSWIRPVVQSVVVPAHAAASPVTTTTTATTTRPTTTTTRTTATTTTRTTTTSTTASTTSGTSTPTTVSPTSSPAPTGTGIPSDVRLKRDMVKVGRLDNGIGLYRYRYRRGEQVYVGVMAQEVLRVVPEAVVLGEDGHLRVDYARLGLRLMLWEEWAAANSEPFQKAA